MLQRNQKEKILTVGKFLFPLLVLIFVFIELNKFIGNIDFVLLHNEINQLFFGTLILIFILLFIAVLPMILYDLMLIKILSIRFKKKELVEQSIIANTYSNLLGFGGIFGVMLRTFFYHKLENDKRRLLSGIATVSFFYLTGISFFSLIVVAVYRDFGIFSQAKWLYFTVLAFGLYLPAFLIIHFYRNKKDKRNMITVDEGVKLFCISLIEWSAIFVAIWLLCGLLNISIGFEQIFPIYVVSVCAGIISMIPGGLGSFDLVFIWGMQFLLVAEEKVLVLLLFYRIGYYLLPFLFSTILFIKYWKIPIKIYYFK